MTEFLELLHPDIRLARQITAAIAAGLLAAPLFGSLRLVTSEIPLVRWFSLAISSFILALIGRAAWGAFVGPIPDGLATISNLLVIFGAFSILRYFLIGIPESERHKFNMFTAPFYPPWGITKTLLYVTQRMNNIFFGRWRR